MDSPSTERKHAELLKQHIISKIGRRDRIWDYTNEKKLERHPEIQENNGFNKLSDQVAGSRIHESRIVSNRGMLHFIALWFIALHRYFGCCKMKVCDSPVLSESISVFLPKAFAHVVSLCHIFLVLNLLQIFTLLNLLW